MLMPAGRLDARDGRRWRLTDADAVGRHTRPRRQHRPGDRLRASDQVLPRERTAGACRRMDCRVGSPRRRVVGTHPMDRPGGGGAAGARVPLPQSLVHAHARRRCDVLVRGRVDEHSSARHAGSGVSWEPVGCGDCLFQTRFGSRSTARRPTWRSLSASRSPGRSAAPSKAARCPTMPSSRRGDTAASATRGSALPLRGAEPCYPEDCSVGDAASGQHNSGPVPLCRSRPG